MKSLIPKYWKWKLVTFILYICLLVFWWYMDFGCVFKNMTGILCPGCGLTRAWLFFIKGNPIKALQFHPMFWSIPILLFYFIYDGVPLKNKKINNSIFFLILLGWFLNYLLKLFLF